MTQEQFDDLKKRLEDCVNARSDEERDPWEELRVDHFIDEKLKILNSGIFLDGNLRGKQLTGSARKYEKYQINDFEEFIAGVTSYILSIDEDKEAKDVFSSIILLEMGFRSEYFEKFITFLRKKRISKAKELENIRNNLFELTREFRDKIYICPKLPNIFKSKKRVIYKNVDSIFLFFKKHIPDAPEETIAARISELLKIFNIGVKPGTILQRQLRAKK